MEPSALQGTESVCVKAVPCEDVCITDKPTFEGVSVRDEPLPDTVLVKDEPGYENVSFKAEPSVDNVFVEDEPRCESVSIKAEPSCSYAELYTDHVVEDELVLGPKLMEQRGMRNAPTGQTRQKSPGKKSNPYQRAQCQYTTPNFGPPPTPFTSIVRTHSRNKPHRCGQCSYASLYETHLQIHMWNHTGEKLYKCGQCSYSSNYKKKLLFHIKKHTDEKPYKCDQCIYASNDKKCLSSHTRNHIKENPYKCDECAFTTIYKRTILSHIKYHTDENPYKCDQCTYATNSRKSLFFHIQQHAEKYPYQYQYEHYYGTQRKSGLKQHVMKQEVRCYVNKRRAHAQRLTVDESQDVACKPEPCEEVCIRYEPTSAEVSGKIDPLSVKEESKPECVYIKAEPLFSDGTCCQEVCIRYEPTSAEVSGKIDPLSVKEESKSECVCIKAEPSCSDGSVNDESPGVSALTGLHTWLAGAVAGLDEPVLGSELVEQRLVLGVHSPTGQTRPKSPEGKPNPYQRAQCEYTTPRITSFTRKHTEENPCEQYDYGSNHKSNLEHHVRKPEVRCYVNKKRAQRLTVDKSRDVA